MKTLYININGEDIQSSNDIVVVGTPDDNIVDKFYYELGKEIVKDVDAPGIRGLAKHIVKSYKDIDEKAFGKITEQWLRVKDILLGENPTGFETIELPIKYVKWLQNYGDTDHTEIAQSLYARNCLVEISLDKIYRNSVNIILNSIEPDNYGQFVVNDEVVTDDSSISIAIMKKFDGIAFKPYKKEDVSPNCEMNPCECPKACPKCGKNPCECLPEDIICFQCYENLCKLKKGEGNNIGGKQNVLFEKETESDIVWSADDVRKLERFFPQYKGGLDYIGKSGEDYLLYGYKDELRERNNADIVTSLGKMLFALKKEDGIVVSGVLPSGLLILEKCEEDGTTHYGIVCQHGKILIPCEKGEHKRKTSEYRSLRVFEKSPGVIQFPNEKYYINAYTKEQYVDVAGDYGLKIKSEDNDSLIDIVNINNGGIISSDVTIDNEPGLREIGNGWYLVKVLKRSEKGRVDKVSMVFNEERLLFLDEKEAIMKAESGYLINNDRIITAISYREVGAYIEWSYFSEIRIRDYSGNIIKVISSPQLYITDPYNYGKLAAFIIGEHEIAKSLVYLDMQGNEHRIQFNVERFHYSNLRAYFISETEIQFYNGKSGKRSCIISV